MSVIAVTGAAGPLGRRVVERMASTDGVGEVLALDRTVMIPPAGARFRQVDLREETDDLFAGCDSIVHLADDAAQVGDLEMAAAMLDAVLRLADKAECGHLVLLSSALVYGAYPGNPIPLTEQHRRRPIPGLGYATVKARMEEIAEEWALARGAELAILRPTTTLSDRGSSPIADALRTATLRRGDLVDAPVQFLHHDDLAAAVCIVGTRRLSSTFNVAPDGWIGPEAFHHLLAEAAVPLPEPLNEIYGRFAERFRSDIEPGLIPYVDHPWVVANDHLRTTGWAPSFSNEEALVEGTPAPWWRSFTLRRRQELALGAATAIAAGAVAGAGLLARRLMRPR